MDTRAWLVTQMAIYMGVGPQGHSPALLTKPAPPGLMPGVQVNFALGDDATIEAGRRYMKTYYAFTGPFAEKIAAGLLTNPQAIAQFLRGYEEAGCDELVLFPALPAIYQLEQLAEILIALGRSTR